MLTRKRVIATAAGAFALSVAAASGAWATISPKVDRYENDDSFGKKPAYHVTLGGKDGRTLIISFEPDKAAPSPFHNDVVKNGNSDLFEKLLGVSKTPQTNGIRWSVKFGKGKNHEARLVIHFVKNYTSLTGGFTRLRYDVQTHQGVKHSFLLFDIGGLCGKASCS